MRRVARWQKPSDSHQQTALKLVVSRQCNQCGRSQPDEAFPETSFVRRWRYRCFDCQRENEFENRLALRYGIGTKEYYRLEALQKGLCAICKTAPAEGKRLVVDHDHATGEIRGLLCNLCNTGLGGFRDDPSVMEAAIHYIKHADRLYQIPEPLLLKIAAGE